MPVERPLHHLFPRRERTSLERALDAFPQHPFLSRHTLHEVGRGGYRVVFSFEKHPQIVAKVDRRELQQTFHLASEHSTHSHAYAERLQYLREQVQRDRKRLRLLRSYFGVWVPRERIYMHEVPMTAELAHLLEHPHDDIASSVSEHPSFLHVPAVVHVQERLSFRSARDIGYTFLERDSTLSDERYARLHRILAQEVSGAEYLQSFTIGRDLLQTIRWNPRARTLIKQFLEQASLYTLDMGEMLDLAGHRNCFLFVDQTGEWNLSLPDGLTPREHEWTSAHDSLERYLSHGECDRRDAQALLHAINYTRFFCACANVLEIPVRDIPILPHAASLDVIHLRRTLLESLRSV